MLLHAESNNGFFNEENEAQFQYNFIPFVLGYSSFRQQNSVWRLHEYWCYNDDVGNVWE